MEILYSFFGVLFVLSPFILFTYLTFKPYRPPKSKAKEIENLTIARNRNIEDFKKILSEKKFEIDKESTYEEFSFFVDDKSHKWCFYNSDTNFATIYNYSDIIDYKIKEDNNSIVKGRMGSAVVGGLLFGGIGAIAGSAGSREIKTTCSSLSINIVVNDIKEPNLNLILISSETKKNSSIYQKAITFAENINGILKFITTNTKKQEE